MNYCFSSIYRKFILLFFFLLDNDVRESRNVVYFLTVLKIS